MYLNFIAFRSNFGSSSPGMAAAAASGWSDVESSAEEPVEAAAGWTDVESSPHAALSQAAAGWSDVDTSGEEQLVGPRLHYLREPRGKYLGRPAKSGPHSWETSQVGGALVGPRLHYLREPRGKCSGPDLMLVHKQSLFYLDGTASQLKQRQCRPSQREMLLHLLLLWLFVDCAFQM